MPDSPVKTRFVHHTLKVDISPSLRKYNHGLDTHTNIYRCWCLKFRLYPSSRIVLVLCRGILFRVELYVLMQPYSTVHVHMAQPGHGEHKMMGSAVQILCSSLLLVGQQWSMVVRENATRVWLV